MTTALELHTLDDVRKRRFEECPKPRFKVGGRRLLVYERPGDEKYGMIVIPDTAKKNNHFGVVIQVGEGFHPVYGWDESEESWSGICPYKVGDLVAWSKYENVRVKCTVDESWWTEEQLEQMKRIKREEQVEFVILEVGQVLGTLTEGTMFSEEEIRDEG